MEICQQNADIIVFPEDGLTSTTYPSRKELMDAWTTAIPSPLDEYVPCTGTEINISEVGILLSTLDSQFSIPFLFLVDVKKIIVRCEKKSHLCGSKYCRERAYNQRQ